ncbi:3-hydroxyacyl-ACP dehydratase FabZ family protein [Gimesia chilikensis]|uniref:3-hydroxyacyl-ACP dehydratase FabZ family protein n=1 Tax=Gimesia chilikensis TaxID=2605989 RepID=UPI00118B4B39|nr:3-hydroxyacyl-ACP dehydratase FabZ family protein [Gimesia chilikensis]QDT82432.1 3-hydroxyacyl-[acyl-carrier-protein] dehydratase FabZ [Gimesia chilikensis]
MQTYRHEFPSVEDYLHHRAPYLMVDSIQSISDSEIVTSRRVTGEEYFLQGHFPGAPVVPGAMMQEMTTQSAGILIAARYNPMPEYNTHDPHFNEYALGVLVKVEQARFKGIARPGDQLEIRVNLNERLSGIFDFRATIAVGDKIIMRNRFQLTNIESSVLTGPVGV